MLQFLLEALPHSLNETHTIFLYARLLEQNNDPAIRYRANATYESFYSHLKICERIHEMNSAKAKCTNFFQIYIEMNNCWTRGYKHASINITVFFLLKVKNINTTPLSINMDGN